MNFLNQLVLAISLSSISVGALASQISTCDLQYSANFKNLGLVDTEAQNLVEDEFTKLGYTSSGSHYYASFEIEQTREYKNIVVPFYTMGYSDALVKNNLKLKIWDSHNGKLIREAASSFNSTEDCEPTDNGSGYQCQLVWNPSKISLRKAVRKAIKQVGNCKN